MDQEDEHHVTIHICIQASNKLAQHPRAGLNFINNHIWARKLMSGAQKLPGAFVCQAVERSRVTAETVSVLYIQIQ